FFVVYFSRAGIYTSEEVIEQAIDRWLSYTSLCRKALGMLRQQMIEAYVPYAVDQQRMNQTGRSRAPLTLALPVHLQSGGLSSGHGNSSHSTASLGRNRPLLPHPHLMSESSSYTRKVHSRRQQPSSPVSKLASSGSSKPLNLVPALIETVKSPAPGSLVSKKPVSKVCIV
ncbi:unnamed protein product, partial [Protopolystoma xenopodis]